MDIQPYERKAHYYETDQMGIIHHSNYIRWFEEARVAFMEQIGFGYARTEELGIYIPVLSVSCEYKSMVRFGDMVRIHSKLAFFSGTRMTVEYRVMDSAGNTAATGQSAHCFLSSGATGRPVSLKRILPELYGLFMSIYEQR